MVIHNCLFCHGEDCFNLLSVSQMLRSTGNEVTFSQELSRISVRTGSTVASIDLVENEGLYQLSGIPLYLGDEKIIRAR